MPNHVQGLGAGADPSKLYIQKRRIDNLKDLAGLSNDDVTLLNRADGVIANLPKDGFIQAPELKDPNFNAMLLPQESSHLPSAWDELSWDGKAAPDAAQVPSLSSLVKVTAGQAPKLDRNEPIPISSLPQDLQTLAQRVQLQLNGDSDASTISPSEAGRFAGSTYQRGLLPEEAARIPELVQAVYAAHNKLHPYVVGDKLDVGPVGHQTTRLNDSSAQGVVNLTSDTALTETRGVGQRSLALHRSFHTEVTIPPGAQGLLMNPSTGEERRLPEGTTTLDALNAGDYLLEVWKGGKRIDESEFHMPQVSSESVDLTKYVSASFSSNGAALSKSFTWSNVPSGQPAQASWDYVAGNVQQPPSALDLSRLEPAKPSLEPGVYQGYVSLKGGFTWNGQQQGSGSNFTLEVRNDGTVNLSALNYNGLLDLRGSDTFGKTLAQGRLINAYEMTLQGKTLALRDNEMAGSVELKPSDRIQ